MDEALKEFERILAVGQANPQLRGTSEYRQAFRNARNMVLRAKMPLERYKGVLKSEYVEALNDPLYSVTGRSIRELF